MKLTLLISVFSAISLTSSAQTWVEDNAKWTYDYWNIAVGGYYIVEDMGDSLLAGQMSTRFETTRMTFGMTGPSGDIALLGNSTLGVEHIYSSGDSVFRWNEDQYRLLFDFNAQVNDSWLIDVDTTGSDWGCTDSSSVIVVDNGIENIQGVNYRYIELASLPGSFKQLNGRFNERFAGNYFIPQMRDCDSLLAEYDMITDLRCFEDDSLSLNFSGEDCLYMLTHLNLNELDQSEIVVSPNPTSGKLEVKGEQIVKIDVFGTNGTFLKSFSVDAHINQVDLSTYKSGVYLLRVYTQNGVISKRVVKQ